MPWVTNSSQVVHRLLRGLGAQGFAQVVNLFIRLAEVPLFLAFWGAERYGEWLMVAAIPTVLAMADGGFTGVTSREMMMRVSSGDRVGALAAFQSTWVLLIAVSIVVGALIGVTVHFLPLVTWFNLVTIDAKSLSTVMVVLTIHVLVGFQTGLLYGGFCSEGQYAKGTLLSAFVLLLEFGGLASAVALGGGPVQAAWGYLVGRVAGLGLFLLGLRRVAPWLHYGVAKASRQQIFHLTIPSLAAMAFPLGNALNIQGMRLAVGVVLDPVAVAAFSAMRTLCRMANQPMTIVIRLIEPEIALAFGAGQREVLRRLFSRSCQVVLWIVVPTCLALWFAGEEAFALWTRGEITLDESLYALLLLVAAANSLWNTALMVPYATNRHEWIAMLYVVIYGCSAVILAILLMPRFGFYGAGVALLIAELAMVACVLPTSFRLSGETGYAWVKTIIRPPVFVLKVAKDIRWK